MTSPQYIKEGWRPAGPGRCKCPNCGASVSTNALARARHTCRSKGDAYDVNGKPLFVGDQVRKVEFGKDAVIRTVKAIGDPNSEHLRGFVMVTSSIAWENGNRYERLRQ